MIKVNIHQAKTQLSKYINRLQDGEIIVLCKRNVPVAEIRPLPASSRKPRPIGLGKGRFEVPASFFEPLPSDLLDSFGGGQG
jgi:antitoxin (DNA-binding transcriptional repressor) of toxin-antitoxin stability system